MALTTLDYHHGDVRLKGQLALPDGPGPHPAVLVMHDARGQGYQVIDRAERLAALGYVALASDMYGDGQYYDEPLAGGAHMQTLHAEPDALRERILLNLGVLQALPQVDSSRIAAIGFCFGGECVLDLARSGADVRAVVSYHGLLSTQRPAAAGQVKARVVVYAGAKDPYAPAEDIAAFNAEMAAAGASTDVTVFSEAYHAFTDPRAAERMHVIPGVRYDAVADAVSWAGTLALFEQVLRA